jgi:hypothetical protein
MSKLEESEVDMNNADTEDLDMYDDSDSDWGSKKEEVEEQRNIADGKTLNNSFTGQYPTCWDHLHIDKGPNHQFPYEPAN